MANASNIVDPLDAEYAISEILGALSARGMSTTDLAVEIGWKRKNVEDVLYSPSSLPKRSDLDAMAKALDIELEWEEE